jgi:hypothetical protein
MRRPSRLSLPRRLAMVLGVLMACGRSPGGPPPLRVEATPSNRDTRLTLIPQAGLKISARLAPALELADGTVLRFSSPALTPDSAYFAEPPSTILSGRHLQVHGELRASVCDTGASVCRSVLVGL